jgi:uncharacterized protein (TIGR02266 family)
MKRCSACHGAVDADSRFCGHCGFRLEPISQVPISQVPISQVPTVGFEDKGATAASAVEHVALARTELARQLVYDDPPISSKETVIEGQRRLRRHMLKVEVGFYTANNFYSGQTENISAGGLFIATPTPAQVGEHVDVELLLPSMGQSCKVRCEVRWVRKWGDAGTPVPGMGLEFTELDPKTAAAIAAFITHRRPLTPPSKH